MKKEEARKELNEKLEKLSINDLKVLLDSLTLNKEVDYINGNNYEQSILIDYVLDEFNQRISDLGYLAKKIESME